MGYHICYGFTDFDVNGLVFACWTRDLELLKKEITNGADVNSSDPDGVTAITHASNENGFIEGVRLLLEAGADPTIEGRRPPYNAIRAACCFGHLDILRLYDKYILNEQILSGLFPGVFPIQTYKFLGQYLKKMGLIVDGSQLIMNVQSMNCEAQLHAILDALPVDINYQDENGKTVLHHYVAQMGLQASMIERFLKFGVNPNLKDNEGNTALKTLRNSYHRSKLDSKAGATLIRSYGGRYEGVVGIKDWLRSYGF